MLLFAVPFVFVAPGFQTQSPRIELPPGPLADALARIAADVRPATLPEIQPSPWEEPATWRRWADLLVREAPGQGSTPSGSDPSGPARRAELALLALAQQRWDDAWDRVSACADAPATFAALLPHLLPGARAGALEDGVRLAPALPPSDAALLSSLTRRGLVERRAMRIEGLKVGAAVIALRVSVENEGVEIDVEHLSGGAAKLSIAIPEDPQFGFGDEYVDWYRQEQRGVAHEVALLPGDPPHTLYARFEPRAPAWPTSLPERVPAQISAGMIWLESRSREPERALLEAVAESLASGPLHLSAGLREPHAPVESSLGVSIDLCDPRERPRKLAWIVGVIERRSRARSR